jgi:hypothetical protein
MRLPTRLTISLVFGSVHTFSFFNTSWYDLTPKAISSLSEIRISCFLPVYGLGAQPARMREKTAKGIIIDNAFQAILIAKVLLASILSGDENREASR